MSRTAILLLVLAAHTTAVNGQTPERPRVFLLVIDDLHLDFRQTPRTRALIQETVDTLAGNGALWSVVSTGTSSLAVGPTADLSTVRAAIRRMIGNGLKAEEFAGAAAAERQRRADAADQAAAAAIADVAATLNRETLTVLYVSGGYDTRAVGVRSKVIDPATHAQARVVALWPWTEENSQP